MSIVYPEKASADIGVYGLGGANSPNLFATATRPPF